MSLQCSNFRPVCLTNKSTKKTYNKKNTNNNVLLDNIRKKDKNPDNEISKCGEINSPPIAILDYILEEIKKNNKKNNQNNNSKKEYTNQVNNSKKEYTNPETKMDNCYSTDVAWLVVIKDIEKNITNISMKNIEELAEQLKTNINNETNKSSIPNINLLELFNKIIKVANSKWGEANNKNNKNNKNIQIRNQILTKFKELIENINFIELSNLIDRLLHNGNLDMVNSNNKTQQISNKQIETYKEIIKNLFVYTIPIMNSETDLSNVFGRDFNNNKTENKIDRDFNEINEMLELFSNKKVNGGFRYNKKTKKNNEKRKIKNNNTDTKKNMRGGDYFHPLSYLIIIIITYAAYYLLVRSKCRISISPIVDLRHCQVNTILSIINNKYIFNNIVSLTINTSDFTDNDNISIIQALTIALQNNKTLTTLDIRVCDINYNEAAALAIAFESNKTITTIDISNNNIGDVGANAFAKVLESNKESALITLNIAYNLIGNVGATALAKALESNTILTTLNIFFNNIGDEGATALAEALKKNTTLKTLNIGQNNIGDVGARALARELKSNTTLTSLNINLNEIGEDMKTSIESLIESNRKRLLDKEQYNLSIQISNYSDSIHSSIYETLAKTGEQYLKIYTSQIGMINSTSNKSNNLSEVEKFINSLNLNKKTKINIMELNNTEEGKNKAQALIFSIPLHIHLKNNPKINKEAFIKDYRKYLNNPTTMSILPKEIWHLIIQYLSLEDGKNFLQVLKT